MNKPTPNPYLSKCPSRELISLIGNKWTLLIFPVLSEGPCRHGELMRRIDGVSQKMLTKTLKDLEENGLVLRTDYHEVPPKVDYRLTELGQSLGVLIGKIDTWVVEHFYETQSR